MNIYISNGIGHGKTPLSAFDAALSDAGVHNFNLIYLSSIVPPRSVIKIEKYIPKGDVYGHRLYVVKSEIRSREAGEWIGASLGWVQVGDGRGVFVEHSGKGETKEAVEANLKSDVTNSLMDLCHLRKIPVNKDTLKIKTCITQVGNEATSVIVAAVYKAEAWE